METTKLYTMRSSRSATGGERQGVKDSEQRLFLILGAIVLLLFGIMIFSNTLNLEGLIGSPTSESGVDKNQWSLILIDKEHGIPDNYQVEFTELLGGESVDSRIYPSLQKMFDDARAEGFRPVVASGYRTWEDQQVLLDNKIAAFMSEGYSAEEAEDAASTWVSKPGYSEHQLGIVADINDEGFNEDSTELYEWLKDNSYKYGFVLRYAEDKGEYTNCAYEPWHYRYVGTAATTEMHSENVCIEEYLGRI